MNDLRIEFGAAKVAAKRLEWERQISDAYSRNFSVGNFRQLFTPLQDIQAEQLKDSIARDLNAVFGLSFAPYRVPAAIHDDQFLLVAHNAIDGLYNSDGAASRAVQNAAKIKFSYNSDYDTPRDALHRALDYQVNRTIVGHLLKAYKSLTQY